MYRLYGIKTQNTFKALYVLEELGLDYEFKNMDLAKGEHKSEAYLKINPLGKVPALQHDEFNLFESGAIVRYLGNVEGSSLYPAEPKTRAVVDQWLDFMSSHLGRWLSVLFFEHVIKKHFGDNTPNAQKCEEAEGFSKQFFEPVDKHLKNHKYFAGKELTIADICAFAYIEQVEGIPFEITNYPNVQTWYQAMKDRPGIVRAKTKLK